MKPKKIETIRITFNVDWTPNVQRNWNRDLAAKDEIAALIPRIREVLNDFTHGEAVMRYTMTTNQPLPKKDGTP